MKKRKFDFDFEDIILRTAGIAILVILAFAFFAPEDGQLRNRPLLYTILLLIIGWWSIKVVRSIRLLYKTKRLFIEHGATNIKLHINPFGAWLQGNYGLFCTYSETEYSVVVLLRKNPWTICHFEVNDRLEYYKSTRSATRKNKVTGAVARGGVYTRRIGKRQIKWFCNNTNIAPKKLVIFNKMPLNVTTYATSGSIDVGMCVCDNVTVYDRLSLNKLFN